VTTTTATTSTATTTSSTFPPSSSSRLREHRVELGGGRTATVRFTGAPEGDLAITGAQPMLDERRARVAPLPWTWLTQVHGSDVVLVAAAGDHAGEAADAAVTAALAAPLAIHTADCAPIALVADEGVIGAVHAGWRGLVAGVVEHTVETMRSLGAGEITAILGPCIHAPCYEFGAADLAVVAGLLGDEVRSTTADGRPALDLPKAARVALERAGVALLAGDAPCTACAGGYFSHRARQEAGRQAMVVWLS
jgi:YfiH family protein